MLEPTGAMCAFYCRTESRIISLSRRKMILIISTNKFLFLSSVIRLHRMLRSGQKCPENCSNCCSVWCAITHSPIWAYCSAAACLSIFRHRRLCQVLISGLQWPHFYFRTFKFVRVDCGLAAARWAFSTSICIYYDHYCCAVLRWPVNAFAIQRSTAYDE